MNNFTGKNTIVHTGEYAGFPVKNPQISSKNKARALKPKANLTSNDFQKAPVTPSPLENE